jgi:hypothetical protein
MSDAVLTETRGRVLLITLNRPEAMNAINTDLAQGLLAAVQELVFDALTAEQVDQLNEISRAVLARIDPEGVLLPPLP